MSRLSWSEHWNRDGGGRELLRLAFPLILSNSFWTLQITIDRVLLSRFDSDSVGAAMAGALLFWSPLILLQSAAGYSSTFVAQYFGAGRRNRVGPAVWQALYFSLFTGLAFLAFVPLAGRIVAVGGHSPAMQELEATYFRCLCYSTLPTLITAAVSGFFTGRGDSWTVLLINAVGLAVNGVLDYVWIFGGLGFPAMGIGGAGWATVAGTSASAAVALGLMFRPRFRREFATWSARFDPPLFGRLMYYGVPSGLQAMLDCLAFTFFTFLVGRIGEAELSATSIAFTLNMVAFLPMLGIGQAVAVLVGQRLGQDRPALAERTTWTGFGLTWAYMSGVAILYVGCPGLLLAVFRSTEEPEKWAAIAAVVPVLLRFVAVYCLFDSVNLIFSFALKGAGDTLFVTAVSLVLAWPVMVLPSWLAVKWGWGLYWAWAFASAYIIALAFTFLLRFRHGRWKQIRVIEKAPAEPEAGPPAGTAVIQGLSLNGDGYERDRIADKTESPS